MTSSTKTEELEFFENNKPMAKIQNTLISIVHAVILLKISGDNA